MTDLARLYAGAQGRIVGLVSPLGPQELATRVPGTPRWTIHQLVAHLAGVCADMAGPKVEGAGDEMWSARQVAERANRSLSEVLAEWRGHTPALLALLAEPRRVDACAFDILTHEHDLRGALGLAGPSDAGAVYSVTERVAGRVGHLATKAGLGALRLVHDGGEWICGTAEVAVTGRSSTMEWFRALFGRRSASQILTYDWDHDPSAYFDLLNLFGPLPAAEVVEAGAPVASGTSP